VEKGKGSGRLKTSQGDKAIGTEGEYYGIRSQKQKRIIREEGRKTEAPSKGGVYERRKRSQGRSQDGKGTPNQCSGTCS